MLSTFLFSLIEEAIAKVVGLITAPCYVWLALKDAFSHRLKAKELHLKDDLQLMIWGTKLVIKHACAFKALCDQLHAIRRLVDDTKVHWCLHCLSFDFANFSTTQMALTSLSSFFNLISKAKIFESFQKSRVTDNSLCSIHCHKLESQV